MRPLQNALAAALALAFAAGTAAAATTATPAAMPSITTTGTTARTSTAPASTTFVNTTPALSSAPAASSTVTIAPATTQAVSPPNATSVDVRNQQTLAATAATHASGSTSAIDNLLTQPAAANTGSGTTTGATPGTTGNGVATNPFISGFAFANPSDVTSLPGTAPVNVASNATLGSDVIANAQVTQFEKARADANVNRAIAQVQRDRKRVGRNGQVLYSIAPRTNVDRSAQMPDDGPPPSLTGSFSTLTR